MKRAESKVECVSVSMFWYFVISVSFQISYVSAHHSSDSSASKQRNQMCEHTAVWMTTYNVSQCMVWSFFRRNSGYLVLKKVLYSPTYSHLYLSATNVYRCDTATCKLYVTVTSIQQHIFMFSNHAVKVNNRPKLMKTSHKLQQEMHRRKW